jgi:photosystem II stability/assembly factor-like uncharacterized protein
VGGIVTVFDERNHQARNVEVWPEQTSGATAAELKYRFNWEFPLMISPHDHNRVYVGSQFVHVTTDGGSTWKIVSPDLTRNDKSRMGFSGGLTGDNIGVEYAGVVFALAESPKQTGVIWAGTNDGLVQITRDGGKTWTNLTANIPGMPEWGTVSNIEASRYANGAAYIAVDGHQVNNRDLFLFKTTDYGKTWTAITNGIPHSMLSYTHCIREDPVRRGLLFAGTENGLYFSFNGGQNWQSMQANLPHAPVYWIAMQEHFHDMAVATYGRGFWILDDLTPLEQMTPKTADAVAVLFAPRDAYRFRTAVQPESPHLRCHTRAEPALRRVHQLLSEVHARWRREVGDRGCQRPDGADTDRPRRAGHQSHLVGSPIQPDQAHAASDQPPLRAGNHHGPRWLPPRSWRTTHLLAGASRDLHCQTHGRRQGLHPDAQSIEGPPFQRYRV